MTEAEKIKAQIAELQKQLEAVEAVDDGYWVPQIAENYYYVLSDGCVRSYPWCDFIIDNNRLKMGNVFRTEKEADHEAKVREAYVKFKRMAKGWKFTPRHSNFSAVYVHDMGIWDIYSNQNHQFVGQIYFKTQQDCKDAIAAMGDEMDLLKGV